MSSTREILDEREGQYGAYTKVAEITIGLRGEIENQWCGVEPTAPMKLSLDMICNKVARLTSGDSTKIDTWEDIAGYAQLVVDELKKG